VVCESGLLRVQTEMGVVGPVVEIGPFEGRFFIAIAHALAAGEIALGIDLFDWPNAQVIDRFEANCARHGLAPGRHRTWKGRQLTSPKYRSMMAMSVWFNERSSGVWVCGGNRLATAETTWFFLPPLRSGTAALDGLTA